MKTILKAVLFLFLFLIIVLAVRTFFFSSRQQKFPAIEKINVSDSAVKNLAEAIRFATVSYEADSLHDTSAFSSFHKFLYERYPKVFSTFVRERISSQSLLLRWDGSDVLLKPVIFLSHQDVVPATDEGGKWTNKPFSGDIDAQFIYGRGTIDDKCGVLGLLEAAEYLLSKNVRPKRTIYFAFGHDEEVGGSGAGEIAAFLSEKNIEAEFILDEGGSITDGIIKEVKPNVAVIGIAEKGRATIDLSVDIDGGHSSMPPKQTAIGILSEVIVKLEAHPFEARYDGGTKALFDYIAPEMNFTSKMVFANAWLFNPIIKKILSEKNSTNAAIRTTTAATIFKSGEKENVLPHHAEAVINFRILPGETAEDVVNHVKKVIQDERVQVKLREDYDNPSAVSNANSAEFKTISKTIKEIFPEVIVAPYLVVGATDARHYQTISKNIYRFIPLVLNDEDLKRMHGINERINIENYKDIVRFYVRIIENVAL
jgi:carboxypeptidase PM20D1